ncbi:YjjG family noncanonical pyrimidine nucleotidase [Flavihumibacter sp. CACIAM 22H1]|uniref:YjjG family noncanonical pyrimidine nucleotidase n=1 Tax=Flavihumibacter sp. CACIAM 22H1 TaxID=1812911 RepID=UPI0007A86D58|nr:YjjG family noncanonical pyrimidine nucleotidase [Flavihumibacter sp. CACIAM 22H1]KYP15726.1 MAG: haloacid dehalogenase [Flavihumibacter sp. CACIAM 22H1]
MKHYSHLFFDLDHTLWDFEENARLTLEHIYKQLNLSTVGVSDFTYFHERYCYHNDKLWERYRKGFIKVDELRWKRMWHTLLDFKIGDEQLARELSAAFLAHLPFRNRLFPYAVELLTYLHNKGYSLHLITNGFESVQHAKLKNSGIDHFFGKVITSEGSNSLKPNREIFDYAFRVTGAVPETSIMIGDHLEADILGAKNAGMDQVFVNHIKITPSISPTYTVYGLEEMMALF